MKSNRAELIERSSHRDDYKKYKEEIKEIIDYLNFKAGRKFTG